MRKEDLLISRLKRYAKSEKRCKLIVSVLSISFAIISLPVYYLKVEGACVIALTLVLIAIMQIVEILRRG